MENKTKPSILRILDAEVSCMIAERRAISKLDGLRLFLNSRTHEMLCDDDMKLWHFSPAALFDIWENEVITGDPGNSFYLCGDEIG